MSVGSEKSRFGLEVSNSILGNSKQSFHVVMNKFENLPEYGKFFPFMLNVILNISLVVGQNLPRLQILAALQVV